MKSAGLAVILLLSACALPPSETHPAPAAEDSGVDQERLACDQVMALLVKAGAETALEPLRPYINSEEGYTRLRSRTAENFEVVTVGGDPFGSEFVRMDRIGTSYKRYLYLIRFPFQGRLCEFEFYRSPDGWLLTGLTTFAPADELYDSRP